LTPGGDNSLLASADRIFKINIGGTIHMDQASGNYPFEAGIYDPLNTTGETDKTDYVLTVLERKTVLVKPPPTAVTLPANGQLDFVVFAEGGAPSKDDDSGLDGESVPYYTYAWEVTPVDDAPALNTATGSTSTVKAGPETISITFEDSGNQPVTGTYEDRGDRSGGADARKRRGKAHADQAGTVPIVRA
jgi:hypothetical protein